MDFQTRYEHLNPAQQKAVDTIFGPLIVIAGPGTGKTELLSMRVANILRSTDTSPESILCLTFTDSGATAMRARLASIIGPDAYKVAIQTFHSFGSEVINQHREFFYRGAQYKPADELAQYEIMTQLFDELPYDSPLASKNNGEYTHLRDALRSISELKQAGLTSDELLMVLNENDRTLDALEADLDAVFQNRIHISMCEPLSVVAQKAASLPIGKLPPAIAALSAELSLSLAHAIDAATDSGKTNKITEWRNTWLAQDSHKKYVFKDRARHAKLRVVAHLYFSYLSRMDQAGLYDYDDMILGVVHAMELNPELMYNLQEAYQYVLVDEFQDTNLAQLRILFNLATIAHGDAPNVMVVGDDDQAIYSFQGADVNNIHRFRTQFPEYQSVVLTENYRSAQLVLDHAREVITQATGRLEDSMEIDKRLHAQPDAPKGSVELIATKTRTDELSWVSDSIAKQIASGADPRSIVVLARQHAELVELLPYLHHHNIRVNYERRDNVLDLEPIQTLELFARVVAALADGEHELADSLLPQLVSHPSFGFSAEEIWRLSLTAHRNHLAWSEAMLVNETFKPLALWLLDCARRVPHDSLENMVDRLVGNLGEDDEETFRSPFYEYYFSEEILRETPDAYLTTLEALRTIRTRLRDYLVSTQTHLTDFVAFLAVHRQLGSTIVSVRTGANAIDGAINLMTAHKAKGLEFDTVYVIDSVDKRWGERARHRIPNISFPENLTISPNANTYDERLRLYFVAMTRAKKSLYLTYAEEDEAGKATLPAGFLSGTTLATTHDTTEHDIASRTQQAVLAWHDHITQSPTRSMRDLLAPTLERYKLSSTHLNNFIDLTHGGPAAFLMKNLLRFPQEKSAHASYGTAIHETLQRAHDHLVATGERRPVEDVLGDFAHLLESAHLTPEEHELFLQRGTDSLTKFLRAQYDTFTPHQKTELNFAGQNAVLGDAHLTGSLDLADIDARAKTITVTDYKTGKPSRDWKGASDTEKIKLHRYRQQLMFYELLVTHSRDYAGYQFERGILQFVEPDRDGELHALDETFTADELAKFSKLIGAVWRCITTLDFPDVSQFEPNYKGILAFEQFLIDNYS